VVEATIITPVLLLLLFGVFEFGLYFRDYLTTGDAIGEGARIGGIVGPDPLDIGTPSDPAYVTADYAIVAAIREATASIDPTAIERIVVFDTPNPAAGSALDQVRPGCRNGANSSSALRCNVYPGEDAFYAVQSGNSDYFDCTAGGTRACGWDPYTRDDGPNVSEIDYLGVYIKMNHPWVTGIFGDSATIEQATIIRLEPGEVE
jgi:Flp pilus assembly protein TadG